jgi:hypothetical protein
LGTGFNRQFLVSIEIELGQRCGGALDRRPDAHHETFPAEFRTAIHADACEPCATAASKHLPSFPAIRGLTGSLTNLSQSGRRTILARLRRARLLVGEDPHNPGQVDTHPLVREYFGEQLRSQQTEAWKECNQRLFTHYRALAPQLPETLRAMEPLFSAVICGCNAGLYREALHEVYIPRVQRGNACFAANVLGARGALLSVLAHFFEVGH